MSRTLKGASFFHRGFDATIVREDLVSQDETRQVPALMQTIAFMAMGKDMSPLFTEVSTLTSSHNTTLKRLAYIYLQQYSRVQPEKAVLQAGTFVKDTLCESPLARGAGIRSMTSLQVAVINDFVKYPLRRLLEDSDPYVRRNAVLGFLKSVCISHSLLNSGILEKIVEMLRDNSPVVVGACILTLQELSQRGIITGVEKYFADAKDHFVHLLDESTEWPSFYMLEGLADSYSASRKEDAQVFLQDNEDVIMRVLPFTCFTNSALVVAASKVICQFLLCCERCLPQRERWEIEERFGPCLVRALVSQLAAPRYEIRYVVLCNIQLLLHTSFTRFFQSHLSAFRLLFTDPLYVKLEKIRCLVLLANEDCGSTIVEELYAHAVSSVHCLSSESIRAIGTVASSVETLAVPTVTRLEALIDSKIPRVVEEAVMVLQQLLRYYPNRFPSAVQTLCDALPTIKGTDAIAAVVWAVGEHSDVIRSPIRFLEPLVEKMERHSLQLQMALMAAVAKLSVQAERGDANRDREKSERALQVILNFAVQAPEPMLRDRALFYLRLLVLDPLTASRMLGDKAVPLEIKGENPERQSMRGMLGMMGTLVSVKHKPISLVLNGDSVDAVQDSETDEDEDDEAIEESRPVDMDPVETTKPSGSATPPLKSSTTFTTVLSPEETNGLRMEMGWDQLASKLVLVVRLSLLTGEDFVSQVVVEDLQLNRNAFGLGVGQVFPVTKLSLSDTEAEVNLLISSNNRSRLAAGIEVAVNIQPIGLRRFLAPPVPPLYLLLPPLHMDKSTYAQLRAHHTAPAWMLPSYTAPVKCASSRLSVNTFRMFSLTLVHRVVENGDTGIFLYGETTSHEHLLYEITVSNDTVTYMSVFAKEAPIALFFGEYLLHLLRRITH
eukprot:gene2510-1566_t